MINTTSKPGLPSNNLPRNQHGQTRRKRHNKKRKQDTRDETDTTTIQSRMLPIKATVAYLRARSVRTLRDPANLRARSVRTQAAVVILERAHLRGIVAEANAGNVAEANAEARARKVPKAARFLLREMSAAG